MIIDFIQKGGPIMWPLIGVAKIAFYLIGYKWYQLYGMVFRYRKNNPILPVRALAKDQAFDEALKLVTRDLPCEKILSKGVQYLKEGFVDEAIKDRLDMIYEDEVQDVLSKIDSGKFLIHIDENNFEHSISSESQTLILKELKD